MMCTIIAHTTQATADSEEEKVLCGGITDL